MRKAESLVLDFISRVGDRLPAGNVKLACRLCTERGEYLIALQWVVDTLLQEKKPLRAEEASVAIAAFRAMVQSSRVKVLREVSGLA
jgi:hypothetical protein